VVALSIHQFVVTDASGRFVFDVPATAKAIAWVRVPDGFVPDRCGRGVEHWQLYMDDASIFGMRGSHKHRLRFQHYAS